MRLEIVSHRVSEIRLSDSCTFENGILRLSRKQIDPLINQTIELEDFAIITPGESVRVAPVLDVVEPRAKENPVRAAFPGFCGKDAQPSGNTKTHVLKGVAVVAVAQLPGIQEGLIDMQAEAAAFCPFSRTLNVILRFKIPNGVLAPESDHAIRESTLRVAEFLGAWRLATTPSAWTIWSGRSPKPICPKPRSYTWFSRRATCGVHT